MIKGKLEAFWETGTEGIIWSVYMDGKEGYDALYYIDEDDYITIYNEENKVIYEGDIVKDRFSNWYSYPMNPLLGQQTAGCYFVHWIQANVNPDKWSEWFNKQLKVKITKSSLSKKNKQIIKNKIIKDYFLNRSFNEVILNKSQISLSLKNPKFYDTEDESVIVDMILMAEKKYQIFNDKYYTIINITDNFDSEIEKIEEKNINKNKFSKIDLKNDDLLNQLKKCLEFKKEIRNNYSKHLDIVFGKVNDEKYLKEYSDNEKLFKNVKKEIAKELFKQINEIKSYKVKKNVIKLVYFSKKITNILQFYK